MATSDPSPMKLFIHTVFFAILIFHTVSTTAPKARGNPYKKPSVLRHIPLLTLEIPVSCSRCNLSAPALYPCPHVHAVRMKFFEQKRMLVRPMHRMQRVAPLLLRRQRLLSVVQPPLRWLFFAIRSAPAPVPCQQQPLRHPPGARALHLAHCNALCVAHPWPRHGNG